MNQNEGFEKKIVRLWINNYTSYAWIYNITSNEKDYEVNNCYHFFRILTLGILTSDTIKTYN